MGLKGGMLVTNPIPDEYAMDLDYINRNIDAAIAEAKSLGIHGKDTTPFLLDKIQKLTGGDSLKANIQLVYNNARLGAQIASELAGKCPAAPPVQKTRTAMAVREILLPGLCTFPACSIRKTNRLYLRPYDRW